MKKWQIEKNWEKLREGIKEKKVVEVLGEPDAREQRGSCFLLVYGDKKLGGEVWISTNIGNTKIAKRSNYTLDKYREPFWYLINKELYEEVKDPNDTEEVTEPKEIQEPNEVEKKEDPNKPTT